MNFLFAGGGTGGHLFPGVAVAQVLAEVHGGRMLFLATSRAVDWRILDAAGFNYQVLPVARPAQKIRDFPAFLLKFLGSTIKCFKLLKDFRADVVVGLGGFGSVPAAIAAAARNVPLVLLEQNAVPGKATRFLSRWACSICLSFDESRLHFREKASVKVTGNPVRKSLLSVTRQDALKKLGLECGKKTVLVLGGSQGAGPLNRAFINAASSIARHAPLIQVIHQTGTADLQEVKRTYERLGLAAKVQDFFDDMASVYAASDVAVSRAGATTVAELACIGVPAVFVPYPLARDDHQRQNALAVARKGGAMLLDQTLLFPERIARLMELVLDEKKLSAMRQAMLELARPQAADAVATEILRAASFKRALRSKPWASTRNAYIS